jgi:outer membrane protein OmpA-like peptidoglycan-associated protein/YHS domain-containing protein
MSHLTLRFTIILFSLLVLQTKINAQSDIKVPRSSLKVKWEGFWEAYENIEKGDKLARKGKGGIPLALEYYLKAYEYNNTCPELNCKIGLSYLRSDRKSKALTYLISAYEKNNDVHPELAFWLAMAYHYSLEFDKAAEYYNSYLKSLKEKVREKKSLEINHYIDQCKSGKVLMEKPVRAAIKIADSVLVSEYDDYNSIIVGNDSIMYFTSRRPSGKRPKRDRISYMYDEDVYVSVKKDDKWVKPVYLDDCDINSKRSDAMLWVTNKEDKRYFYDGFVRGGTIYVTTFKKNKWTNPDKLTRRINSKEKESSLSITADGKTMYFVSDNSKNNFGGKDIFYSKLSAKGKWEEPKNLGSNINTIYDEEGVYIRPDGKTLYFSSKGHNSMGGYDIFKSELDASGKWSKPENIGYPVNTPDDELFFRPLNSNRLAYFSSVRNEGKGGWDIYRVIFLGEEKKMLLKTDEQLVAYFEKPLVDIFSKKAAEVKIDSSFVMKGIIMDAATKAPLKARLNLIDIDLSQAIGTAISDSVTGAYQVSFPKPKNYGIEINAKDYMFYLDVVDLSKVTTREVLKNFTLNKIKAGTKVVLKNIYFETGKAVLKEESFVELDKVVGFLKENTDLKIEISGHTDNVGGLAYNIKLSGNRAQAVVDYLVSKGIAQEQLIAKGYGPNQPIAPNTNAKGRQLNRRVEFKILSVE